MGDEFVPFHLRQRNAERAGQPVIYKYDELPEVFRVQAYRVMMDAIGKSRGGLTHYIDKSQAPLDPEQVIRGIGNAVSDDLGLSSDGDFGRGVLYEMSFGNHPTFTVNSRLTMIETAFRVISKLPAWYQQEYQCPLSPAEAIKKLNRRFRENDLGYAFEVDRIIRVDSQYAHSEIVEPALQLLTDVGFNGAQQQFLSAHTHFKQGRNDDAIMNAGRAFESTLKHICDERDWEHSPTPQAKELIRVVSDNGLFPTWHESQLGALGTLLTGLPTTRNKEAGHARTTVQEASDDVAKLALHLCATNIVFAVEAYNRLRLRQESEGDRSG